MKLAVNQHKNKQLKNAEKINVTNPLRNCFLKLDAQLLSFHFNVAREQKDLHKLTESLK